MAANFQTDQIKREEEEEDVDFAEPCNGPRCSICQQIDPGNYEKSLHTCRSKNVVYEIAYPNGPSYIGITSQPLSKRMSQHRHAISSGHGDGRKFIEFYQKNDFDNARITILDEGKGSDLFEKEKNWIQKKNTLYNGLNSEL